MLFIASAFHHAFDFIRRWSIAYLGYSMTCTDMYRYNVSPFTLLIKFGNNYPILRDGRSGKL